MMDRRGGLEHMSEAQTRKYLLSTSGNGFRSVVEYEQLFWERRQEKNI